VGDPLEIEDPPEPDQYEMLNKPPRGEKRENKHFDEKKHEIFEYI
jgi:hypothetical protein